MILFILGIFCSYLLGAVPFAYIFTRLTAHLDIRKEGSGNAGSTNVLRVAGGKAAFCVLALDILKGTAAVSFLANFFLRFILIDENMVRLFFAGSAVIGHIWPVFLNFRGGKGVAVSLGVCLGLSFYLPEFQLLALTALIVWFLVFMLTRYVSAGSILSAVSLSIVPALLGFEMKIIFFCLLLSVLIIFKHHENIKRLLTKRETKIFFRRTS